jgi:hypothetical protein
MVGATLLDSYTGVYTIVFEFICDRDLQIVTDVENGKPVGFFFFG